MRSFSDLEATETLFADDENFLGTRYVWKRPDDIPAVVQRFEHAGGDTLEAYVTLHHAAHLWVHEDYEHDAWYVLDVDEPIEVGIDFVVLQRRNANSLRQFEVSDDPPPTPPRLAELRALLPKLQAAAQTPRNIWIANLVASRLGGADWNTVYVVSENRFHVEDLAPTRDELQAWAKLADAG